MSIRLKLIAGFLLLIGFLAAQGYYAVRSIQDVGTAATQVFEGPLMVINHARSGQHEFAQADWALDEARTSPDVTGAAAAAERLQRHLGAFRESIAMLSERSAAEGSRAQLDEIARMVERWSEMAGNLVVRPGNGAGRALGTIPVEYVLSDLRDAIQERLSTFVEAEASAAFDVQQRTAAWVEQTGYRNVLVVAAAALIGALIALLLSRNILSAFNQAAGAAERIAAGDLEGEISTRRRDEGGKLLRALASMQTELRTRRDAQAQAMRDVEREHERSARRQTVIEQQIGELDRTLGQTLSALAKSAEGSEATARRMSGTVEEMSRLAGKVAEAAREASQNVSDVRGATDVLSRATSDVSTRIGRSNDAAGRAVDESGNADRTVRGMIEAAQRIGEFTKLISGIAGQTNLLALNATIEAARAGEAGRGFAIVANEVKTLASQTAKATEDISAQINSIQGVTEATASAISEFGRTVGQICGLSLEVSESMDRQQADTRLIAEKLVSAASRTGEVAGVMMEIERATGEIGQAFSEVLGGAASVAQATTGLRTEIDGFFTRIRAA